MWDLVRTWLSETLKDTFEHAARPTLRWALSIARAYLLAAALAVTTAVFILSSLVHVLIGVGVPPWAAHLMMAGAAALAAFLFYRGASRKSLSEEFEKDREEEEEVEPPSLRIRVTRGRDKGTVYDVHPRGDGWEVSSGSKKKPYATKESAVKGARRRAARNGGRVVIHGADGRIQNR